MDRIEAMRVFTRVFERRSFTLAAEDMNIPRSTVTDVVKRLEQRIGVVLLERTTRQVTPTIDGSAFYTRCLSIIQEVEDAESAFSGVKPKGALRIDVHGTLARHFLLPKLPQFLAEYPEIEMFMSESDKLSDAVKEGIDCVIRVGSIKSVDLIARQIGLLEEITVASPDYLQCYGIPLQIEELENHKMIGFRATGSSSAMPLEFTLQETIVNYSVPVSLMVNSAETLVAAAQLGLGIIQVPSYHVERSIRAGLLVPILKENPPEPSPVSVLYPRNRQYSPRVKAFLDWLSAVF